MNSKHTDTLDKNPILHSTHIDILRHGECEGGAIFRGATDVALLPKGFEQMQRSCDRLPQDWQLIISSPLRRCREFAQRVQQNTGAEMLEDKRLREMHFGVWDGQEIDHVWKTYPGIVSAWRENPETTTPPEGEPLGEVFARVGEFYQNLLEEHAGKKILLVSHGGIIRVLLSLVLRMQRAHLNHFEVPYASVSTVGVIHTEHGLIERLHAHNF